MASLPPGQSFDTPNIPASSAVVISHSTTRIAAPASLVFRTLRNTETWKDWTKWVARVNITYQPPDEDLATAAEINELVRNTSIAGSFDSDLTDGYVGPGNAPRKTSSADHPPTPPLRLRQPSNASKLSARSGSEASEVNPAISIPPEVTHNRPHSGVSAAQKYSMAQEERRSSIASGKEPPAVNNNLVSDPTVPVPLNSSKTGSRRKSKAPSTNSTVGTNSAISRAKSSTLIQLYGEPSVRIQLNTKMTLSMRMTPSNPNDTKPIHLVVTEVSRPDDPITEGTQLTALTRSKTHTLSRQAIYRIVWSIDHSLSSLSTIKAGSSFPKSLLMAERVHEIRPIYLGDGSEECEYRTWECQKGHLAKVVKKKYGDFNQGQFEAWGKGLGAFCEALGGKVDRRDFILEQEVQNVW